MDFRDNFMHRKPETYLQFLYMIKRKWKRQIKLSWAESISCGFSQTSICQKIIFCVGGGKKKRKRRIQDSPSLHTTIFCWPPFTVVKSWKNTSRFSAAQYREYGLRDLERDLLLNMKNKHIRTIKEWGVHLSLKWWFFFFLKVCFTSGFNFYI